MIAKERNLTEVYVWELPVRIFHWVNATCITFLIITGVLIAFPPAILVSEGAHQTGFWFGYIRLAHISLGVILIINFLVRIYWFYAGNKFAKLNNYIPLTKRQWRGILETIKVDVFLLSPNPIYDIGHNSLAAFTYFGVFILMIMQALSGIAMCAPLLDVPGAVWFEGALFKTGGFFFIRYMHYIIMWLFILFIIAHVYLVFYHDYIERNGVASSIIGGWKYIDSRIVTLYKQEVVAEGLVKKVKAKARKLTKQLKKRR